MKITIKTWLVFLLLASAGLWTWYRLGYAQFKFLDLSVTKSQALADAKAYLKEQGADPAGFLNAVVFSSDDWSDRYLQKTIGLGKEERFVAANGLELFSWQVRFFKDQQKEEYIVAVSPASGRVIGYQHLIEDVAARQDFGKEASRKEAETFLKARFGMDPAQFDFHEEQATRYDHRVDYSFSWEKKNVYIPWKKSEGGAKVLIGATVSGKEIRSFYKNSLDVPEAFTRYIENSLALGEYLTGFSSLFFILFFSWSVYIVIKRRNDVITRIVKKWFVALFIALVIIHIANGLNNIDKLLVAYPSSVKLQSYLGLSVMRFLVGMLFLSITFVFPGIAGESLRAEALPTRTYSCFLHFLRSSFFSRRVASSVALGYLFFFLLLGLQAALFTFGQKYLGVWKEWISFTRLSSATIPFVSAFAVGVYASLTEEVLFRLFGISWTKKYFRNILVAVALPAVIWGFGHSTYPVFPVWFRGIEVSLMGFLYAMVFLRYGLIPLIVAHYLFDVYWGVAGYILGHTTSFLFGGSLVILLLPLAWALVAFLRNRNDREKEIRVALTGAQVYNLGVLIPYVQLQRSQGKAKETLKKELLGNNWDLVLVDLAINEVYRS